MENQLSKKAEYGFSKYTKEEISELYVILKQRALDNSGYNSNKYRKILFEMMKEIKEILDQ